MSGSFTIADHSSSAMSIVISRSGSINAPASFPLRPARVHGARCCGLFVEAQLDRRRALAVLALTLGFPLALHAQRATTPTIGFLESGSPAAFVGRLAAFRKGLAENGYVEGRNLKIEYRWAEGQYDRLPAYASELVERGVAVIAATGSPNTAGAAQAATKTIPIVFANGGDPVKLGLVASLSNPGGNSTGVCFFNSALLEKRIELVRQLLPKARLAAIIVNPKNPNTPADLKQLEIAASNFGLHTLILNVTSEEQLGTAFCEAAQHHSDAILVHNDTYFSTLTKKFAALANQSAIPAIYFLRDFVVAGGLISYGTNVVDMYREAGIYTAKILKGAKPGELPVLLPTKFEFIVNLRTAKILNITIPQAILIRADEVIE
jgi:putative ABC transport system substrate-binding protein